MGGSTERMKNFAEFIKAELKDYLDENTLKSPVVNLSKSDRYVLYKVGPVLSANVSCCTICCAAEYAEYE